MGLHHCPHHSPVTDNAFPSLENIILCSMDKESGDMIDPSHNHYWAPTEFCVAQLGSFQNHHCVRKLHVGLRISMNIVLPTNMDLWKECHFLCYHILPIKPWDTDKIVTVNYLKPTVLRNQRADETLALIFFLDNIKS